MVNIHDTGRDFSISFPNRKKLIQFVSNQFAHLYKNNLELKCVTASGELKESLKKRITSEVPRLKETLEKLIKIRLMFNKKFDVTYESKILEIAFKMIGVKASPESYFPVNVRYKINIQDLVLKKEHK